MSDPNPGPWWEAALSTISASPVVAPRDPQTSAANTLLFDPWVSKGHRQHYEEHLQRGKWPYVPPRENIAEDVHSNTMDLLGDVRRHPNQMYDHPPVIFAPSSGPDYDPIIYSILGESLATVGMSRHEADILWKVFDFTASPSGNELNKQMSLDQFRDALKILGLSHHRINREDARVIYMSVVKRVCTDHFNPMTYMEFIHAVILILQKFHHTLMPEMPFGETNRVVKEYDGLFVPSQKWGQPK